MVSRVLLIAGVLALVPQVAIAQSGAESPKPGPEHKRLEFFVGKWKWEGVAKPSQFGPGGKTTGTTNCEWFEGRFQVICRSELMGPSGNGKELEILAYSPAEAGYTRYNITSDGQGALAHGKLSGKTWQWHGESKTAGKSMRFDFPWTETSPDSYTAKLVVTSNGAAPVTVIEGTGTRIKQ